jgi:GT2 family glycosyltransferase
MINSHYIKRWVRGTVAGRTSLLSVQKLMRPLRSFAGRQFSVVREQFDPDFYAAAYQLPGQGWRRLIKHYLRQGWRMGFDPAPYFSTQKYLEANPDVKQMDVEPFYHYLRYGRKEGRQVFPSEKLSGVGPIGRIENAVYSPHSGLLVVAGWCLPTTGLVPSLSTGAATVTLDDGFRQSRPELPAAKAGFLSLMRGIQENGEVSLDIAGSNRRQSLSKTVPKKLSSDPRAASEALFSIQTSLPNFAHRVPVIDEPFLRPLIQKREQEMLIASSEFNSFGVPPEAPLVDIVIPLYGTLRFLDNQLLHFSQDDWIRRHASIVYVLDDPRISDQFRSRAQQLQRLYGVSFTCVDGGTNRGYAGANNLGASAGGSEYILFMNSDVIPQDPYWLARLIQVFRDNPGTGAVAPRLTFADGTIQFAGMEFQWHEELQIWINHHPLKGCSVDLDPSARVRDVQCLTGACLLLRRADFALVDGWDTGYLVGDFEDSDLCLKLRRLGLRRLYAPHVQLTHLERQSMAQIGSDEYRLRLTIFNAVRHQSRWGMPVGSGWRALEPVPVQPNGVLAGAAN